MKGVITPNNEFVNEFGPVLCVLNLSHLHVYIMYMCCTEIAFECMAGDTNYQYSFI